MPFADNSVYKVPDELSDEQVLFLAELAAILTARLYTPGRIVAIDLADSRLESAVLFGADTTINNGRGLRAAIDMRQETI